MIRQISSSGYLRKRLPHELLALQPNEPESLKQTNSSDEINSLLEESPISDTKVENIKATDLKDERQRARLQGYEGDPCGDCGNFTLVRNGTCMKCNTCGGTSGCS